MGENIYTAVEFQNMEVVDTAVVVLEKKGTEPNLSRIYVVRCGHE